MSKNKFEVVGKILDNHLTGHKYVTRIISGGFQFRIYSKPQGVDSYINCWNSGNVTFQGKALPAELQKAIMEVCFGIPPQGATALKYGSDNEPSYLRVEEILSMYNALRPDLLNLAEKNPVIKRQLEEIPEVYFD